MMGVLSKSGCHEVCHAEWWDQLIGSQPTFGGRFE